MAEGNLDQVLSAEAAWCVLHGDMRDVLSALPDCCIDAVVCDPPYHLTSASRGGSPRKNDPAKPHRRHAIGSKGFMGKTWDGGNIAMDPDTWAGVFRVLKPGAHLVSFGGTRTMHRITCAIEDAGFEIRDVLTWLYASGFPKSLSVSKAIDAKLGAERKIVGIKRDGARSPDHVHAFNASPGEYPATEPTTEPAKIWTGWGTAVKPAHEPICLARKPFDGTVAENVLKYGTGALNVDSCRVKTNGNSESSTGGDAGRWPSNILLSHSEDCRAIPNRTTGPGIAAGSAARRGRRANGRDGEPSADRRYDDKGSTSFAPLPGVRRDSTETAEQWECVGPNCPVWELARQSGTTVSSDRVRHNGDFKSVAKGAETERDSFGFSDQGSAARYFPQFQHDPELDDLTPFLYLAKASRSERDRGLEHFRPRTAAEATDSEDGQARLNCPRTGAGRTGGARNIHPTVKPVDLLRWLVRLICPSGGIVLDTFAGSGSTGIACLLEGARFVGCELNDSDEEPYVSIARARLHYVEGREFVPRESLRTTAPPDQQNLFLEVK